jgi:hypothetical protein
VTGGKHALLTCSGTWAPPGFGYPSDVAHACLDVIEEVPVQAPWSMGPITGGGQGMTAASYQESIQIGIDWACGWLLEHPNRTFLLGGYSQGGECASRIYQETLSGGRIAHLRKNYVGGFTFGNPSRWLEHTFYGGPPRNGEGIAEYRMSDLGDDWADEVDQGDMYGAVPANLTGEIMRDVYTMITEMQLHDGFLAFAQCFAANCVELLRNLDGDAYNTVVADAEVQGVDLAGAQLIDFDEFTSRFGDRLDGSLRGRVGDWLDNRPDRGVTAKGIAAAIAAAIRAITFFAQGTRPHIEYQMREVFPGQTYLQHAIQHVHHWAGTRAPTQ